MVDSVSQQRLKEVHPVLASRATYLIDDCASLGIYLRITMGLRSQNEQHALYLQGRQPLDVVNEARLAVGWAPITDAANESPVTDADYLLSMHCYGLALDADPSEDSPMAPFNPDWKVFDSPGVMDPKWAKVLEIAKTHQLAEGAQWTTKKRDYPHFFPEELAPSPTPEMQQALKDAGVEGVWNLLRTTLLPF